MTVEQIAALAALPLQVLLMFAIAILYRRNVAMQEERIADLKSEYQKNMEDLRTRVAVLEGGGQMPVPNAPESHEDAQKPRFQTKQDQTPTDPN